MSKYATRFKLAALPWAAAILLPGLASAQSLNEQQELLASAVAGAASGKSVSIVGSTAIVGVPNDNSGAGDVYVFTRTGTTWTQQAIISATDATAGDNFGAAVSLSSFNNGSGTTPIVAVGAPGRQSNKGAVYTFTYDGANWNQNAVLAPGAAGNKLGTSVSLQGLNLAAGAPFATSNGSAAAGAAFVFSSTNNGTTWSQANLRQNKGQTKPNNNFGTVVSLSGNTVLIGSPGEKSGSKAGAGQTYVFVSTGGVWRQQARLAPAGIANAHAGSAVALSANTAVIGAPNTTAGDAYVYTRTGTTWSAPTHLGSGSAPGDNYGASVAASGTGIVVGAPLATNAGAGSGRAFEYTLVGANTYSVNELVATNNAAADNFGTAASIDSGYALVSAPVANAGNGAAYVFAPPPADIPTTTTITSINGGSPDASTLIGQSYTVNVTVSASLGTAVGSVSIDDGVNGDTCTATLIAGAGSCTLTNSVAGLLPINASYGGSGLFLPSTATPVNHQVDGPTLVFVSDPPPDVMQGEHLSAGTTVQVLLGGVLDTSDNTTQITVTTLDPCGGPDIIFGTVTASGGIADFSGIGPRFYELATDQNYSGPFSLHAAATNAGFANSGTFNVVTNTVDPPLFASSFEDLTCAL